MQLSNRSKSELSKLEDMLQDTYDNVTTVHSSEDMPPSLSLTIRNEGSYSHYKSIFEYTDGRWIIIYSVGENTTLFDIFYLDEYSDSLDLYLFTVTQIRNEFNSIKPKTT